MFDKLTKLRRQLALVVVITFLITPGAGLLAGTVFGLVSPAGVREVLKAGGLPIFLGAMVVWVGVHFWHFLDSFWNAVAQEGQVSDAAAQLQRAIRQFGRDYWGLFLVYALAAPTIFVLTADKPFPDTNAGFVVTFMVLQLAVSIFVGLPPYLLLLDKLGRMAGWVGVGGVQHKLKSRIMLLGGLVPLLAYSILMQYYILQTGYISIQTILVWAALGAVTVTVAGLSAHSLNQSLRPVRELLGRSGAATHEDFAELRAQSTDEIGYLTQTINRVFRRLSDQQSHMHAVVDNAAEGIIVADERGAIETFNIAAEQLFGFRAQEVRGRPLAWLLPALVDPKGAPRTAGDEQETDGLHRDGRRIPMSVRVSEMELSGKPMYTCLVADISKRKAAEEKQRSAESRYRDLVETAQDLVWSMDAAHRWTYLNSSTVHIYGYDPEEMIGRPVSDFQAPEYAHIENTAFSELCKVGELSQFETVHLDRNGNPRNLSFNAKAQFDDDGELSRITGTTRDITEKKIFERQLTYQAEHDALTGLYNRRYFQQELERVTARVNRSAGSCGLLYIDLDQFKYINDTLGHAAGDRLLLEIAALLTDHVREGELLARFGGDEFTLLLYNVKQSNVLGVAEKFRSLFESYRFLDGGKAFNVSCSIGAAVVDADTRNAEEALAHADLACNTAKTRGRNRVHLYDPTERNQDGMAEDMGWAARVRDMVENDRVLMMFQPIVNIGNGKIYDFEVLMRMPCEDGQVILPGGFMPAAERFGLIHSVDRWMVRRSIEHMAELRDAGRLIRFSINLSGHAFEDESLLPLIRDMLERTSIAPERVTFEITETAAIANLSAAIKFIGDLKETGCQFSLDDFGSGFCSFTYLKHLPVDKLKIDGAFVQSLAHSPVDQAMVRSMNEIAHALGKATIAECVEDRSTFLLLSEFNVDFAQGNYLSEPYDNLVTTDQLPMFVRELTVN